MRLPDAALLAGGLATRLGPLARDTPKAMLEVGGRPFIDWQLERMAQQGVQRAVLCLGHLATSIQTHVGNGSRWGLTVDYCLDGPQPLGTGGALKRALPQLGDPFYVLYADSWLDVEWAPLWERFKEGGCDAVMTVLHNQGRWDGSNACYASGRVLAYDKKAAGPDYEHIDYGLNLFSHAAFAHEERQAFDLGEVQGRLAKEGKLAGLEVTQRFYEIGSEAGLAETRQHLTGRKA